MSEKSAFLPMPTVFFFTEKFRSLSQLVQRPAAAVRANCNERPKAAIRPLSGAASQLPRPDIRAWCSEIVGSQSALRDQAVVRFTCSIGFMVCVRMAPKGGELPFAAKRTNGCCVVCQPQATVWAEPTHRFGCIVSVTSA